MLERIEDNAYKVDLPGEYNISSTFNVSDLSLFDDADLWANHLQERGDDGIMGGENNQRQFGEGLEKDSKMNKDPLHIPTGPITRSRSKKMQQALIGLIQDVEAKAISSKDEWILEGLQRDINLIQAQVYKESASSQA